MKICEIELSKEELKRIKNCSIYTYCSECNFRDNCVVDFLYSRVNSTKYSLFDFFRALEEAFQDV